MALDFSKIGSGGDGYPKKSYEGQENQSYGFQPAFKLQTGNTRGVQTVGFGGAKIDGDNNRIVLTSPTDGTSVGLGSIPGTTDEVGFFTLDSNGEVVLKIVDGTLYVNDLTNGTNIMQTGKLPDGSYGSVAAKEGKNVADVFA